MKKKLLTISIFSLLVACSGVKKTQESINVGNYSTAINKSLRNLVDNKTKRGNQSYIILLEEAFKKNTERELKHITFLQKDGNQANYESIYKSYINLRKIQERIKPLLPLRIYKEDRDAQFSFNNYENNIIKYKEALSEYLYANAENLIINASSKQDYRKAYDDFVYLSKINPGFRNTKQKIEEVHAKGIDYVRVGMTNNSNQIIPSRLEKELLNFNTFGLDDLWTEYHTNTLPNITYDYDMEVSLRDINISPEQINEKEIIKEKQIKDGFDYVFDSNDKVVRDSLGNKIKIDKFKTVRCSFYQFTQFKSAQVTGVVTYTNLITKQQLNTYPLSSEFIFEHIYANYDGDKRALDTNLLSLTQLRAVPFPSNEQMVYDAGEDLKSRLKNIISNQRFN